MRARSLAIALFLGTGCFTAGNYHSARTLEKGESSTGLSFSATTLEVTNSDGSKDRIALPNLLPELTYHIGVADNLEVGGRLALASAYFEGDLKYRFLRSGNLQAAVAPAIGYQAFGPVQAGTLRLPGIVTLDLSDNFALNASLFGSTTHYSEVDSDTEGLQNFGGTLVAVGASLGIEIRGETMTIRPALEFTNYVAQLDDAIGMDGDGHFSTMNLLVHITWIGGREKKQLDRIENKIDHLQTLPAPPSVPAPPQ